MSFEPKPRFEAKPLYNDWETPNEVGRVIGDDAYRFANNVFKEMVREGYSVRQASQIMCDSIRCAEGEQVLLRNINDRAAQRKEHISDLEKVRMMREQTGAALMDCKRALVQSHGDMEAAKELLKHPEFYQIRKEGSDGRETVSTEHEQGQASDVPDLQRAEADGPSDVS